MRSEEDKKGNNKTVAQEMAPVVVKKRIAIKRIRNIILFTSVVLFIGLGFLWMYLVYWQYEVETDDSYIGGHIVYVNAQVSGTVHKVLVEDTDSVQQGDLLLLLDKEDYQLIYDKSLHNLRNRLNEFKNLHHLVKQAKLNVDLKYTSLLKAKQDYARRKGLLKLGGISQEELLHLKLQVTQAKEELHIADQAYQTALNNTHQGLPIVDQPSIKIAVAEVKQAWLNLQRTEITAPISGQIAKRNVQIGQKVTAGQNLLSTISQTDFWVDANFKENQLRKIRIGQPVEMTSDLYGSKIKFHGKVAGLSAGTGSAFSLLPAQNASGNWIKVVQRVPVRIALQQEELKQYPMRIGLSMKTTVFTHPDNHYPSPDMAYQDYTNTTIPTVDYREIDAIISDILSDQ